MNQTGPIRLEIGYNTVPLVAKLGHETASPTLGISLTNVYISS